MAQSLKVPELRAPRKFHDTPVRMLRLYVQDRERKSGGKMFSVDLLLCPECERLVEFPLGPHWKDFPICMGPEHAMVVAPVSIEYMTPKVTCARCGAYSYEKDGHVICGVCQRLDSQCDCLSKVSKDVER